MAQNYPNPFNPETTIQYQLPKSCEVSLAIYNVQGQLLNVLVNEYQSAGFYSIIWQATNDYGNNVPSGVYLYRVEAESFIKTNKMILMK